MSLSRQNTQGTPLERKSSVRNAQATSDHLQRRASMPASQMMAAAPTSSATSSSSNSPLVKPLERRASMPVSNRAAAGGPSRKLSGPGAQASSSSVPPSTAQSRKPPPTIRSSPNSSPSKDDRLSRKRPQNGSFSVSAASGSGGNLPVVNAPDILSVGTSPATTPPSTPPAAELAVLQTTDDFMVAHRSAVALHYFDDCYINLFARRGTSDPLSHRLQHLKNKLMREAVGAWLQKEGRGQVVHLGVGFGTVGLCTTRESKVSRWVDIDTHDVINRKAHLLSKSPDATGAVLHADPTSPPTSPRITCRAYHAVGIESIEDPTELSHALDAAGVDQDAPTLFILEGALARFSPVGGDAVLDFIHAMFSAATLWTWDECSAADTFGKTMTAALGKAHRPLKGLSEYHSLASQLHRVKNRGFTTARISTAVSYALSYTEDERRHIAALEPFDDWEGLLEACSHICIVTTEDGLPPSPSSPTSTSGESLSPRPLGQLSMLRHLSKLFMGWGHSAVLCSRSEMSTPVGVSGHVAVVFGGETSSGLSRELILFDPLQPAARHMRTPQAKGDPPSARCFHQAVMVDKKTMAIFGGRDEGCRPSPPAVSVLSLDEFTWSHIQEADGDQPQPRWRHAMASLGQGRALVFGGLAAADGSDPLGDTWIFDISSSTKHWTPVTRSAESPPPRHSCTATWVESSNIVVVHGGMAKDMRLLNDAWLFDVATLQWKEIHLDGWHPAPRIGHSTSLTNGSLLVVGGSTGLPDTGIERPELEAYTLRIKPGGSSWSPINFNSEAGAAGGAGGATLLTRHTVLQTEPTTYILLGGGAKCSQYATFLNNPRIAIMRDEASSDPESAGTTPPTKTWLPATASTQQLPRNALPSKAEWGMIYARREPYLIGSAGAFGPCVERWSVTYLNKQLGSRDVSVSVSTSPRLTFVPRNYTFKVMTMSELLAHTIHQTAVTPPASPLATPSASPGIIPALSPSPPHSPTSLSGPSFKQPAAPKEYHYLRSVGKKMHTEPSNIWKAFPEIADDFAVPDFLADTLANTGGVHSSALRVAAKDIVMWCHFDIMDNILCQVSGMKRVLLFPPSEACNLYLQGSSSEAGDITACDPARFPKVAKAMQSALTCVMRPGDMLFIPALWCHTTWAVDASISVNVFWRHLAKEEYEPKDLYGNKDLVAAQKAKDAMVKVTAALDQIPPGYREFYVRSLITQLQSTYLEREPNPHAEVAVVAGLVVVLGSVLGAFHTEKTPPWKSSHFLGIFAGSLADILHSSDRGS